MIPNIMKEIQWILQNALTEIIRFYQILIENIYDASKVQELQHNKYSNEMLISDCFFKINGE